MRKGFLIVLAVALVAAMAAPAVAGTDLNGFYRAKGWMSNFKTPASSPIIQKDAPTASYVEQRFRLKFSMGEENVKAVLFLESDFGSWGDAAGGANSANQGSATNPGPFASGAARNTGGALGGDRVQLETKNAYVWFKLPNTSLDFTVGLQGQTDAYAGLLFGGADMAGIFVKGKMEPVDYVLGWAKLYENNVAKWDDMTLYVASAKFAPTKDVKIGLNFYFLQDDTGKVSSPSQLPSDPTAGSLEKLKIYVPGVDFAFNAGPATLSGFFLYEKGKDDFQNPATPDVDIKGFAFDLRGDLNVGPGKGFLEALYVSGGDDPAKEFKSVATLSDVNASPGGNSFFARTDMSILLVNADDINTSTALVGAASAPALTPGGSPSNGGRGIFHVAGGFTMKLADKMTGKVGAGWLRANKLIKQGVPGADATFRKKDMGMEVNANVNYNIMKGLDFGLYGAYAWLGDFYKPSATTDADNAYETHFRLNYAF